MSENEIRKMTALREASAFNERYLVKSMNEALNALNAINNQVQIAHIEITALQAEIRDGGRTDRLHNRANAVARSAVLKGGRGPYETVPDAARPTAVDWSAQLAELRARAPLNFDAWLGRFEAGAAQYEKRLPSDLSTIDHREAFHFRAFVTVHGGGRTLDIGVGPLAKPSYLDDLPDRLIAGLDPLPPFEEHPFPFTRSAAEFLPWPDGSFETVVAATSIDHVYLLDVALAEIRRVLAPGGRFLVWTGIFPVTPPYQPYGGVITAPDEFHLFHPGENWFPALLLEHFRLVERFDVAVSSFANSFLALEKRAGV